MIQTTENPGWYVWMKHLWHVHVCPDKHSNTEDQSQSGCADLVPSLTRRTKWTFSPQGCHLWGLRTHLRHLQRPSGVCHPHHLPKGVSESSREMKGRSQRGSTGQTSRKKCSRSRKCTQMPCNERPFYTALSTSGPRTSLRKGRLYLLSAFICWMAINKHD